LVISRAVSGHERGIELDEHRDARVIGAGDEVEGNRGDAADGDAAEFHRSLLGEAADALIEEQQKFQGRVEG
jgi:hypothetical protein